MQENHSIVIAGAGVFGTALAQRLSWNSSNNITLYSIEDDVVTDINENHQNEKYFPGRHISSAIKAANEMHCIAAADAIFLAIPSKVIESFTNTIKPLTKENVCIINLSKGLAEDGSFLTDSIPYERVGTLKGPTFAVEVMNGVPTGMTFGGTEKDFLTLKKLFRETGFSLDYTADIQGVELLSVLKNMYAIAIGIVSGRYNSPNVDFQVVTKAVNEMRDLLNLYECNPNTIFNFCGIGDLGLTALNDLSRNRTLGLLIGKGFSNDPNSSIVIEGLRTVRLMGEMVAERNLENNFPVLEALYELIYGDKSLNKYYTSVLA